jgi:hypothetical protein
MDIESFSGAATIALASTIVYILVSKSWHFVSRAVGGGPRFADSIMREAAQRFRDEFDRLSKQQSVFLSAGLVFVVLFVAASELNAERLFSGYPVWQLYIFVIALIAGAALAAHRFVRTILERRRVRLLRDANIAVGHQLQNIATDFGRVYHDVETSAGIIDHVIVGQQGVYAINVFAQPPVDGGTVSLEGKSLTFEPGGQLESIVEPVACINALEREFRRLLDHRVRVRSVIATPGWPLNTQSSDEHLVVNDRSLSTLKGWKDKSDHLMNEDVDALHQLLTTQCSVKGAGAGTPADRSQ